MAAAPTAPGVLLLAGLVCLAAGVVCLVGAVVSAVVDWRRGRS